MRQYQQCLQSIANPVNSFFRKTFSKIIFDGPKFPAETVNLNPTMVVCTHRSHLDYIMIGNELHKAGMKNMRFAAGDNLTNLPIIGKKFRSYGAFPVYRAHSRRRNYVFELTRQVMDMLDNQDNIILFPEGGRSYDGSMKELKGGILAASILAQYRSANRTYEYLPMAVSYERLPELVYFDLLQEGKELRSQKGGFIKKIQGDLYYYGADLLAFAVFIVAHRFGKNYGEVYIDYGAPIPVNNIVNLQENYEPNAKNEFFAHKTSIQKTSDAIYKQFLQLYRILPMHVVAEILIDKGTCGKNELIQHIPYLVESLQKKQRNCKTLNVLSREQIAEKGIEQLVYSKALSVKAGMLSAKHIKHLQYYAAAVK